MSIHILSFLQHTKDITLDDLANGHDRDFLFRNTVEELGEYANAVNVEDGVKNKPLKESAKQEAVDVIICALSLFYAEGGTDEELAEYGHKKLAKWVSNLAKERANKKPA